VAHVLVRHRMLIFVAKILWSTTHAPQNVYFGAPQKRFSLLVCYVTMPFSLKNAGATYQQTMQQCMHGKIGQNVHAYVDDVVVKTKQSGTLLDDLKDTFKNLRRYRIKLNPKKYTFSMPAGQLLGYIVSQ
jgi:hypothetical protein